MSKLTEWCESQPVWARDALFRAATTKDITAVEIEAVANRVATAFGIPVEGDHPCELFSDDCLSEDSIQFGEVLLCSIGPLSGVDRLADDQKLKFALAGVTLIFGDNASGKSGYVRAARQLCHARVPGSLRGDVFADSAKAAPIQAEYCFKDGGADPVVSTWTPGENAPPELAGITVLDTENARVYVEQENEILFLPPEVTCLTQLGKLYLAVGAKFQAEANSIQAAQGGIFGQAYDADSPVGRLIQSLSLQTAQADLPSEAALAAAGIWGAAQDAQLKELDLTLAQAPAIAAAKYNRASTVLARMASRLGEISSTVDESAIAEATREIASKLRTAEVARTLASEQIGGQPIKATGSDVWKRLFAIAREFAAEAGIRPPKEAFQIGDPCPLCQRPLDDETARRVAAFDAFVEGQANSDAQVASQAVDIRRKAMAELQISADDEVTESLAEYASLNDGASATAASTVEYNRELRKRRDELLNQLRIDETPVAEPMPASPVPALTAAANNLTADAKTLLDGAGVDPRKAEQAKELRNKKRLHDQLDEVLARRNSLDLRAKHLAVVAALNTLPVSRLATAIRKDLVTPELSKRILDELEKLGLSHIPLRFGEKTERGTSFFEVALATDQRADKESILSEGEQRALSVACFLAESHVAGRKAGIIFDDPVTSLDHKRLRRVAERLVREAATGRQIIIFTHNLLFYQEVLRASADRLPQVPVLPCLIRQHSNGKFGLVANDDQPWMAKKVKDREHSLDATLKEIPDDLPQESEEFRRLAKSFYTDLRETWERAIEEVLFNSVVERFSTDVKTQSLKSVQVTDDDYQIIFHAMKRASEYSGHDRAAGRQIDPPSKEQMRKDLLELIGFRSTRQKRRAGCEDTRRKLEGPPAAESS